MNCIDAPRDTTSLAPFCWATTTAARARPSSPFTMTTLIPMPTKRASASCMPMRSGDCGSAVPYSDSLWSPTPMSMVGRPPKAAQTGKTP